jgi:hypothetical protein
MLSEKSCLSFVHNATSTSPGRTTCAIVQEFLLPAHPRRLRLLLVCPVTKFPGFTEVVHPLKSNIPRHVFASVSITPNKQLQYSRIRISLKVSICPFGRLSGSSHGFFPRIFPISGGPRQHLLSHVDPHPWKMAPDFTVPRIEMWACNSCRRIFQRPFDNLLPRAITSAVFHGSLLVLVLVTGDLQLNSVACIRNRNSKHGTSTPSIEDQTWTYIVFILLIRTNHFPGTHPGQFPVESSTGREDRQCKILTVEQAFTCANEYVLV